MNAKRLVIGAAAAAGVLALGSFGFAAAQTADDPPNGPGMHGTMAGHEQMGNHWDMTGHESMNGEGGMAGHGCEQQAQMHEAMATALGITVADLEAELASGKTMTEIAAEKGVDFATLRAAMQEAHPSGHGSGMTHSGMHGTS